MNKWYIDTNSGKVAKLTKDEIKMVIYGGLDVIEEKDLLRCGKILTNDGDLYDIEWCEPNNSYRIRTIAYNGHVYYHKMINGEVIEIKELK